MDKEGSTAGVRAMKTILLRVGLEALDTARNQSLALVASQGQQYVPFMSSAVNQSIANLINAQKPLLELLRTLQPSGPSIAIQVNQGKNAVNAEKAIGPNEAIMLINQEKQGRSLLENEADKAQLFNAYIAPLQLPEVIATKQQGASKELEANIYIPSKVKKHDVRNELDGTIITEDLKPK